MKHKKIAISVVCAVLFLSLFIPSWAPEQVVELAGPQITLMGDDAFWNSTKRPGELSLSSGCSPADDGSSRGGVRGFPAPALRYELAHPEHLCGYPDSNGFSVLLLGSVINLVFYSAIFFLILRPKKQSRQLD